MQNKVKYSSSKLNVIVTVILMFNHLVTVFDYFLIFIFFNISFILKKNKSNSIVKKSISKIPKKCKKNLRKKAL